MNYREGWHARTDWQAQEHYDNRPYYLCSDDYRNNEIKEYFHPMQGEAVCIVYEEKSMLLLFAATEERLILVPEKWSDSQTVMW